VLTLILYTLSSTLFVVMALIFFIFRHDTVDEAKTKVAICRPVRFITYCRPAGRHALA
jgi:hypothetical protein